MSTLTRLSGWLENTRERIDRRSLRERLLIFAAAIGLVAIGWQMMVLDPLTRRVNTAAARLTEAHDQLARLQTAGATLASSPLIAAAAHESELRARRAQLDARLADTASGYLPPERMTELLREMIAHQQGLTLVSLRALPVEDLGALARPAGATGADAVTTGAGPYIHPVELIVEGDYLAILAYARALEALPCKLQWRRFDLLTEHYPVNRVVLEIGTVSLSAEWLRV
jgi:MSHA biogenesis protein MshJ